MTKEVQVITPKRGGAESLSELLRKGGCREKAIQALGEALTATKQFWSQPGKQFVSEVDHITRIKAADILLSYTDGRPVERKEVVVATFESVDEMKNRVKQSPALDASLREVMNDVLKEKK